MSKIIFNNEYELPVTQIQDNVVNHIPDGDNIIRNNDGLNLSQPCYLETVISIVSNNNSKETTINLVKYLQNQDSIEAIVYNDMNTPVWTSTTNSPDLVNILMTYMDNDAPTLILTFRTLIESDE